MNLWKSLEGIVELELTSADIAGALEAINTLEIPIQSVVFVDDLTARLTVSRRYLASVRTQTEKRGEKLRLLRRRGLFWTGVAAVKRPVLLCGLALLFFISLFLPTRVLFVRVEGNETVPSRLILAAAEDCGIRFGASRREVRSEKVKNALLGALPNLQWAGVNTAGCVATISVRERNDTTVPEETPGVSSIVASRDGVILSCTVTAGNAQCTVGQAVTEGQVLVSGYTDCGILIKATRAEGEIIAQTRHKITAVTPSEGTSRGEITSVSKNYSLILGKKRINLWKDSGICGTTCGRMYEEYYITLPGGFQLPAAIAVETHVCYESVPFQKTPEEAENALVFFSEDYTKSRMVSGTILSSDLSVSAGDGIYRLDADYLCQEMIGRQRQERKVETNGKSD